MKFVLLGQILAGCSALADQAARLDDEFAAPSNKFRPKFRYWLPDGSADIEWVKKDIRSMADVGMGGFEFLPFYHNMIAPPSDWNIYGYGTDAFREVFRATMDVAKETSLLMDFAVGANQGQGVPAEVGSEGLAVHLTYSNVTVKPGETYNGVLPLSIQPTDPNLNWMHPLGNFGSQKLRATTAVEIISERQGDIVVGRVLDLTADVDVNTRSLRWQAPDGTSVWRIMAWYERHTNQRSITGGQNPQTVVQNGSWIVDHFSAKGAEIMDRFFDDHLIPSETDKRLLAEVAKYGWEDSMEMNSAIWWTPGFETRFLEERGYDIKMCLPFLITKDNSWFSQNTPYSEGFWSEDMSLGSQCNDDYRVVLQHCYRDYVQSHVNWAHSRGFEYSNQPAYNIPIDFGDSVPLVDAPEGESWGFKDIIDSYRLMSGPVHVAGIPVLSSECGALRTAAYHSTLTDLLFHTHRGYAGGITQNVFHGFPFTGPMTNTTWPGYTAFSYRYTDMWTPRQPAWRHLPEVASYLARVQYAGQAGQPLVDLALYAHAAPKKTTTGYHSSNLADQGFTYDFISMGSLLDDRFAFNGETIASGGPSYKAVIFTNRTVMEPEAARKLLRLAESGAPIFFTDSADIQAKGRDTDKQEAVSKAFGQLVGGRFPNVVQLASSAELPLALRDANIRPRARFASETAGTEWYSFWRSFEDAEVAWFYNSGDVHDKMEIRFADVADTLPYEVNPWTGQATPLSTYHSEGHDIIASVELTANSTSMFAFRKKAGSCFRKSSLFGRPTGAHITSLNGNATGVVSMAQPLHPLLRAWVGEGAAEATLSSGEVIEFTGSPPESTRLALWNITIEDWHRGEETYDVETAYTLHSYTDKELAHWHELDQDTLANVSGIGTYETVFQTAEATSGRPVAARLHLGPVSDSVRVFVDGVALPPPGYASVGDLVVPLGPELLGAGLTAHRLRVEVATTLYNRIRSELEITYSAGQQALSNNRDYWAALPPQEYGIKGPVWIQWFEVYDLE